MKQQLKLFYNLVYNSAELALWLIVTINCFKFLPKALYDANERRNLFLATSQLVRIAMLLALCEPFAGLFGLTRTPFITSMSK